MPATPNDNSELTPELLSLLLPLHYFYAQQERPLPEIQLLEGSQIPEPEKSLLVHERDMTSTLAKFYGSPITLSVESVQHSEDYVMRLVVLHRGDTDAPVEFGAIGIRLEKFEGPLREQIANGSAPLGSLLEKYIVDYRSCPKGYFSTTADSIIAGALAEDEGATLYGRCNELTDPEGFAFADIVEVLPRASR
ncbi:MAG: chorismate-pyruvate lyase [Pseudoalteromonas tetraodonis]|jgi:chorismate-pyruvate lyase